MKNRIMKTKFIVISIFFLCSTISFGAEDGENSPAELLQNESEVRVGALNIEQLKQLALSQDVKESELVWLDVNYPDQTESFRVLALEQKPRLPQAQGAVLILHDKEQHADWPYIIRPLRMTLPDAGWYTLTVNLPYENSQKYPERSLGVKLADKIVMTASVRLALQGGRTRDKVDEVAKDNSAAASGTSPQDTSSQDKITPVVEESQVVKENVDIDLAEQQVNKTTTLSYKERALLHIKAAMDHLHSKGYQNIVIAGLRSGADLALEHIKPNVAQIPKQGFALVMIDPILQDAYQNEMAEFFGENFKAPVLDIVNSASLESRRLANQRAIAARVASMGNYHQVGLTVNESGEYQQSLLRRVRFWLGRYAPGMAATKVSSSR